MRIGLAQMSMESEMEQYVSRAILLSQKDVGKDNNLNLKPIYMLPFIMEEL